MPVNKAFIYILVGAALWGTIGFYVKNLYAYGFTPMEVVTLRVWTSAFILIFYLLCTNPKSLKLHKLTDIKYFIGTGIFSIVFFNYCMFTAIEISTIPVATALLYTGPMFVTIFSYFLFKEPLTRIKIIALLITLFGTSLVVGLIPFDKEAFKLGSVVFGIGSAVGYALYSIFSKYALRKYSSLTITTFTFLTASIALTPFFPYKEKASLLVEQEVLLYAFGLGLLPTAIAYIIYTHGLNQTEASKASILTTVEPVIATLIGIFIFQESFSFIQMLGMASIIAAVVIVQLFNKSENNIADNHKIRA